MRPANSMKQKCAWILFTGSNCAKPSIRLKSLGSFYIPSPATTRHIRSYCKATPPSCSHTHYRLHKYKSTSEMTSILTTTPQLKVIKNLFDTYISLDIKNVERYFSKNFTFQTFPKIPDLPDEEKGTYTERYGGIMSLLTKSEVRIQHHGSTSKLGG